MKIVGCRTSFHASFYDILTLTLCCLFLLFPARAQPSPSVPPDGPRLFHALVLDSGAQNILAVNTADAAKDLALRATVAPLGVTRPAFGKPSVPGEPLPVFNDGSTIDYTYTTIVNGGVTFDGTTTTGCTTSNSNVNVVIASSTVTSVVLAFSANTNAAPGSATISCTASSVTGAIPVTPQIYVYDASPSIKSLQQLSPLYPGGQASVAIYGTNLGPATGSIAVCSSGANPCSSSDVSSTVTYWNHGVSYDQVNVLLTAAPTSSGVYDLQLTSLGESGTGFVEDFASSASDVPQTRGQVTVSILPQISITSVQFTNSYGLAVDDGHTNPPPVIDSTVWRSSCSSPPCMNPSAFQQGTMITANVTFALSYAPTSALTGVRVEGSMGSLGTLSVSDVTIPAGTTTGTVSAVSGTALPTGTHIYNPLSIGWSAGFFDSGNLPCSQFTCGAIGTSASTVYVTMATPPVSNLPLPLTTLGLAVASGGATSTQAAFANTWAKFSANGVGPANLTTWDGRPLFYYPATQYFKSCATSSSDLLNGNDQLGVACGNGQCGSFKFLMNDALQANGIYTDFVTISNLDGDQFMVKSWVFGGSDPMYAPYSWPVVLEVEPGGYIGMYPLPVGSIFGQITSLSDIPGQNTHPPSEKIFAFHFILKDSLGASGSVLYFDPSYGVTYLNACDPEEGFEYKAVDGYVRRAGPDTGTNFHARMVDPASCRMHFDK
jgi:hypothetical protein